MFIKITTSDNRQYVKLVEAYRDEQGVSRQRVIATLGRLETVRAGGNNALFETWASDTDTFKPNPQFPTTATPMALRQPA